MIKMSCTWTQSTLMLSPTPLLKYRFRFICKKYNQSYKQTDKLLLLL